MMTEPVTISQTDLRKLLSAASPDGTLLYLYLQSGNSLETAEKELNMNGSRLTCAAAMLRQLGLLPEERTRHIASGERPVYSDEDVYKMMDYDPSFKRLYEEVQRLLGKVLTTEELKLLLGIRRYFGLPNEVISVLVYYCKDRSRQRGSSRNPSLRTIEKEACLWAEQGIETLEQAAAYIQTQNVRNTQLERLKQMLQIRGRNLTAGEERYASTWLEMGFDEEALAMAYEKTCLNTGGLNWAYMNKIIQRWHEAGLHTAAEVRQGDRKKTVPKGASGELGQAELEAIARIMQEG